jgi:uncharacterized membrane protein YebE (DUF533 family)
MSDDLKKLLGNLTESVGVSPLVLIGAVGLGFAAYTVYNNWKKSR